MLRGHRSALSTPSMRPTPSRAWSPAPPAGRALSCRERPPGGKCCPLPRGWRGVRPTAAVLQVPSFSSEQPSSPHVISGQAYSIPSLQRIPLGVGFPSQGPCVSGSPLSGKGRTPPGLVPAPTSLRVLHPVSQEHRFFAPHLLVYKSPHLRPLTSHLPP